MSSQNPRHLNEVYSIYDEALLGKGSTGNVYLGCARNNPTHKVAIKSINLHEINNQVTRYLLSCEIAALSNLGKLQNTQHENIVRLLQIIIIDNYIYLVMELLEGGTLADYIKKHPNGLSEEEALSILKQILEGYKRIKDKQIVHRDLKPDNILFKTAPNHNKTVAIIDFGYCEMKQVPNKPQVFYNVGSPKYMSPEAYKQNKYSQKSDIWAIGVMLYEMLLGKTCDNGMTMENYLDMLQTTGIPLPDKLNNFHKHLLTCMLAYNHQSRIQCDEVLKVLHSHQNQLSRPITQFSLPLKMGQENLRATLDINPSQRPHRNNPIFYSALLPGQIGSNISSNPAQQPFQMMTLQRNQSGLSQPNENIHKMREVIRYPATSLHEERNFKRIILPQRANKVQNVQFYSAKQIIHRRNPGNNLIQLKNANLSPFSKHPTQFLQHRNPPNFLQHPLNIPRTAMNQIVNHQIINGPPSQIRTSVNTPKQQLTFSKIVTEPTPQQIHLLQFNNPNPKVHISQFDIGRPQEIQNFNHSPQLKKHCSQEVRFVGVTHFQQNHQNRRQSQQIGRAYVPQAKIQMNIGNQPRTNDLTITRHPFPHLTQSMLPRQDLTMTRVPQYQNLHQNVIHSSDLTQTRMPIPLKPNDLTLSKAQRVTHELNMFHKHIPSKNQYFSERVIMDKIPVKPFHIVREGVSLKPQVSAIRNIDNKIQYINLNPFPEGLHGQEAHLVMVRPNVVK